MDSGVVETDPEDTSPVVELTQTVDSPDETVGR